MSRFPELLTGLFRDFRNSYNTGRVKMDTDLDKALGDSSTALSKASNAETTSNEAKANSERTQNELTQAILAGDSSPLGGQLSVGSDGTVYDGPQERLVEENEKVNALLAQNMTDIQLSIESFSRLTTEASDSARIQRAIDEAKLQNKKLVFAKREYLLSTQIKLPSDIEIDFQFATLKRQDGNVFDMISNNDKVNGNSGIRLKNLFIDGNKGTLSPVNVADRFGGLTLFKVTDSELENTTVTNTVNNELTAGIYFEDCSNIDAYNINGWDNDRTAILLNRSKVRIKGSVTRNNSGSGISSHQSDESEYHDIVTHNNGYSNLSINGLRSKGSNILSFGSAYSGVNIGHTTTPADDTVLSNIQSYDNAYEGLTISTSNRVQVTNLVVYGNLRNNIRIMENSNASKLLNVTSKGSAGGQGVLYESGTGHKIDFADVFENANSGIYVGTGVSVEIGANVQCYNNGKKTSANSAGIILNKALKCKVHSPKCFDNQTTKTQENGLWIAGGDGHTILFPEDVKDNKTHQFREDGSPSNIMKKYLDTKQENVEAQGIVTTNEWLGANLKVYKDASGFVHLQGTVKDGTVGSSAFTLPVGFRPSTTVNFTTVANSAWAQIAILSTGEVIPYNSNINHHINNVLFKAV